MAISTACSTEILWSCDCPTTGTRKIKAITSALTPLLILRYDFRSKIAYKNGNTQGLARLRKSIHPPPRSLSALNLSTSRVEIAMGKNPNAAADAVNKTGRNLFLYQLVPVG